MKRIFTLLYFCLLGGSIIINNATYAEMGIPGSNSTTYGGGASSSIETFTSEKVPGANCTCYPDGGETCSGDVAKRKYKCTTQGGVKGFQVVFAKMIRYVVNIVLLLGVLAVVGVGIAWTFAGGDDVKMKTTIKHWAMNIVVGVIILFMFAYILRFLAPWVYM